MNPTEIFTISHLPTEADTIEKELLLERAYTSHKAKTVLKIMGILLCILSVPTVFFVGNKSSFAAFLLVDVLVLGGLLLFFYYDGIRTLAAKSRAKKAYHNSDIVRRAKKLTLYDARLEMVAGDSRMSYPIDGAVLAVNSANCFVISFGSGSAVQIPKRLLDAAQIDDTTDLLKQKCKQTYCEIK